MCGIFGLVSRQLPEAAILENCLDTLTHRGPDQSGFYVDDSADFQLFLGHRRLSILDLSDAGKQPFVTPDGKVAIAVNGEIYNHRELRQALIARGARFRSDSDSEVLLWGFYYDGEAFFRRLRGMYAAAIWDRRMPQSRLLLLRDRMGIKPLHYRVEAGSIAFASELKAMYGLPGYRWETDDTALAHYLTLRYIPSPLTIWQNTFKVAPGEYIVFESGRCRRESYWQITVPEQKFKGSFEDAAEELDFLLNEAVREQLMGNVPLGAFLSGGIDSSLICAIIQKQMGSRKLKTFTIGFGSSRMDESKYAGKIAEYLGTDHTCKTMQTPDLFAVLPRMAGLFDEPYGDDSALPTCLLSEVAAEEVTIALSGDGGDELFFGYNNLASNWRMASIYEKCPRLPRKLCGTILQMLFKDSLPGRAGRTLAYDRMDQIYARSSGFFSNHLLAQLQGKMLTGPNSLLYQKCLFFEDQHIPERSITPYLDMALYLPDDVCCKVDRASMAHALEVRPPMLDHRIVDFANSLPIHYKYRPGAGGKMLLKKVLEKYIPRPLWDRPKCGFSAPVEHWLDHELQPQVQQLLMPERLQQHWGFDADFTASLLAPGPAATYHKKILLWILFCLEDWFRNVRPGQGCR